MQAVAETKSRPRQARRLYAQGQVKTVASDFSSPKMASRRRRAKSGRSSRVQPNNLDQFRDGKVQPIVWPIESKTGNVIYPYADARKK